MMKSKSELYRSKEGRALAWLAVTLVVAGISISGWQALALAFHSDAASLSTTAGLNNLHQLQNTMTMPSKAGPLISQGGFSDESIKRELHDPVGRTDPFSPLVREPDPAAAVNTAPVVQRDILQDVSYTGFIGDNRSTNKVAIIHVSDPGGVEKTVIKKVGESFKVEGSNVILRSIDSSGVRVHYNGSNRFLSLQAYQASPQTAVPGSPASNSSAPPSYSPNYQAMPHGPGASGYRGNAGSSEGPAVSGGASLQELR